VSVVNQKLDIFRNWLSNILDPLPVAQKAITAERRKASILGFWEEIIRRYSLEPKLWSSAYSVNLLAIASQLKSYRMCS
jgi:hypothetical protein